MQNTVQLIKADEEGEEDTNNQRDKIDQQYDAEEYLYLRIIGQAQESS